MFKILQYTMLQIQLKNRNLFLILCSLLCFSSCHLNNKKEDLNNASPYFTAFFTGNEASVLRNINFNMNSDEVKRIEPSKLFESTSDHLFYEFSFPTDSTAFSEYANIQYFFNENNQLDVISNHIYLNDTLQQNKLEKTLTLYFNEKLGDSEINADKEAFWTSTFKDISNRKKYNYTVSVKDLEDDQDDKAIGITVEYYLLR